MRTGEPTTRLVVSRHATIRVVDGGVSVAGETGGPGSRFGVEILDWIARFAVPATEEDALSGVDLPERERVRNALTILKADGVLVQADADEGPSDTASETRRIKTCLVMIANAVHRIGADLAAFGSYALDRTGRRGGAPVADRVAAIAGDVLALLNDLRERRDEYIAAQVRRLGLEGARQLKLNIGSGRYPLDSWINIDARPADLRLNLTWALPFADGAAQWVRMSHVLEHLYYPGEAEHVLREVRRVLAPDGAVRIVVPDIEKWLRAYAADDAHFFEDHKRRRRVNPRTRLEAFLYYAGAGAEPAKFLSAHKFGYDFETLDHLLRRVGFAAVERSGFMSSRHEALRVDDASHVAGETSGDAHFSLFVEATV
jgi:predicted SAM-dependent methyltransferase